MARAHRPVFRRTAILALALALGGGAIPSRAGDAGSAAILLRAVVQKRAAVTRVSSPQLVRVTRDDVERGYVQVPTPVELRVRSNSADGYLLTFELQPALARGADVAGLGVPVQVGQLPGSIRQPAVGAGLTQTLQLHLSFKLAAGVVPGEYDWPLSISAEPL